MNRQKKVWAAALVAAAGICTGVSSRSEAAPMAAAFDDGTIQPGGPRSGLNGKKFFNIEGDSNGSFASFGVLDFHSADLGLGSSITAAEIPDQLALKLFDAPAAFSTSGDLLFFLSEDTTTSIQNGASGAAIYTAGSNPPGVGGSLGTKHLLGTGSYVKGVVGVTDGQEYDYLLSPDAATKTYLANQIDAGGTLRLLVTPADDNNPGNATVAATFTGFTNDPTGTSPPFSARTDGLGPTLVFAAVPEPSAAAVILLLSGSAGLLARRRRHPVA